MFNPSYQIHREKFSETIEFQLGMHEIENNLDEIKQFASHHWMEQINKSLTRIFNLAAKKVDRMKRNMQFHVKRKKSKSAMLQNDT